MFLALLLAIPSGLAVLAALRLLSARRFSPGVEITLSVVSVLCWIMVVMATLLTLNLGVAMILVIIGVAAGSTRRSQQDTLLWVLAIAVEKQMPLGPSVAAFATECRGSFGRRVQHLADLLNAGLSLEAAVARVPRVVPDVGLVAIQVGSEAGVLNRALNDAAASRTFHAPLWQSYCMRLLYLLGVLIGLQAATALSVVFILPKFEKIFSDFGVALPAATQFLISLSDGPEVTSLFGILIAMEAAAILYLGLLLLGWAPPVSTSVSRRIDAAIILRLLALVIEAGRPLPLANLARVYPRRGVRKRLARVASDVQAGKSPWESLRRHGLIRKTEAAVLESALRAGNLPWALREMADGSERRLGYRLEAWTHVLFSLALVCFALPVAVYVLAAITPLVELIEVLAP